MTNHIKISVLVLATLVGLVSATRPLEDTVLSLNQNLDGDIWALLIAGSAGWGNYRHQADVAHAYHILRKGGIKESNIVVMMYDDIANNDENPAPGTIINHPQGNDLYQGLVIDYSRSHVNAETFLAVLAGNKTAIDITSHSNGRVIEAGPQDRLFVYYSDHGAPGVIGMPAGPFLYADQLHHVIRHRRKSGGFKELVLYIEACESGSMFEGLLTDDLNILAVTAANAHESSWGTYCPGMNPPPPQEYTTCLGDLFSVSWLEDSDLNDLNKETLKKQFQWVKARTSSNFTYLQGSHVMRYGDFDIDEEPASDFLGRLNDGAHHEDDADSRLSASITILEAAPQRSADLFPLILKVQQASNPEAQQAAQRHLDAELARRQAIDHSIRSMIELVTTSQQLEILYSTSSMTSSTSDTNTNGGDDVFDSSDGVQSFMTKALPFRPAGAALVDDWDCLRGMVAAFEEACGELGDYGMQHTRTFANLCNVGVRVVDMAQAAGGVCHTGNNAENEESVAVY